MSAAKTVAKWGMSTPSSPTRTMEDPVPDLAARREVAYCHAAWRSQDSFENLKARALTGDLKSQARELGKEKLPEARAAAKQVIAELVEKFVAMQASRVTVVVEFAN